MTMILLGALALALFEVFLWGRPRVRLLEHSIVCSYGGDSWGIVSSLRPLVPQERPALSWGDNESPRCASTCVGFTWKPALTIIVELPVDPKRLGLIKPPEAP